MRTSLSALLVLVCFGSLARAADAPSKSPGDDTHDQRMKWWREARFGMFIHWGVYSVPAGVYKGEQSKHIGEWLKHAPRANTVRTDTILNPCRHLPLQKRSIRRPDQKDLEHDKNFDEQYEDFNYCHCSLLLTLNN